MKPFLIAAWMCILVAPGAEAAEEGLVGHWDFHEGQGDVLHDLSGNGNHGTIHGATWIPHAQGHALRFDGHDDYVDCGNGASLDLPESITLEVWVAPDHVPTPEPGIIGKSFESFVLTAPNGRFAWYALQGGEPVRNLARVPARTWHHVVGTFDGSVARLYVNGAVTKIKSGKYLKLLRGGNFLLGRCKDFFAGRIASARVYNRALTTEEVQSRFKAMAGPMGVDTSGFDKIRLGAFVYEAQERAFLVVDLTGFLPVPTAARLEAQLIGPEEGKVHKKLTVKKIPEERWCRLKFDLTGLSAGTYTVEASLSGRRPNLASARTTFEYRDRSLKLPPPDRYQVPMLPPPPEPVPYSLEVTPNGGFVIETVEARHAVDSEFSFPHGGLNHLSTGVEASGDPAWRPKVEQKDEKTYHVQATGEYYRLERTIKLEPARVLVRDQVTNLRQEATGIILRHRLQIGDTSESYLGGYRMTGDLQLKWNPTVLVGKDTLRVGLVALDDVFVDQVRGAVTDTEAAIYSNSFAVDRNATHTLEWAVYLVAGNYYDFINQVREDFGVNDVTVDGVSGFISKSSFDRRQVPGKKYAYVRGLKYGILHALGRLADDRDLSSQSVEFLGYPKEIDKLKQQVASIRYKNPDLNVIFHLHGSWYATNKPQPIFPDSRQVDPLENQMRFEAADGYFSEAKVADGWKWFSYYPTTDNTFGRTVLRAVDVIMDFIGCRGIFLNRLLEPGHYTYDHFDGHSADIDPETRTVAHLKASVALLGDDFLPALVNKVRAMDGVVFVHESRVNRSIASLPVIYTQHDRGGPDAHLLPTPIVLGDGHNPGGQEQRIYRHIYSCVAQGNLYLYHEEGKVTYQSVPPQMYPITVEEIYAGCVKGKERLVTIKPGAYGWLDDTDLHFGYRYDGLGAAAPSSYLTTISEGQARSEVVLGRDEMAVIKRIPISVKCSEPLNVVCRQYDKEGIEVYVSGSGRATFTVRDGEFRVRPRKAFVVDAGRPMRVKSAEEPQFSFVVNLDGPTRLLIR